MSAPPGGVIATPGGLADVPLAEADVLVRAGGGVGLPPVPGWQLVQANAEDRPLLLVDVDDRHHARLRLEARKRKQAYAARGWYDVGVEPSEARVEAFLADRTRGAGRE